jgi:hypothetical protein
MRTAGPSLSVAIRTRLIPRAISPFCRRSCLGSLSLALVASGLAALNSALAADPLPVAGRVGPSTASTTLWLDPVSRTPEALLSDPFGRLPTESRSTVLQTIDETPSGAGLSRLIVTDTLPEFWAEPAVWEPFLKGPAAFSGFGREFRARDWAGRMTTDRRAYALDPGLEGSWTPATFSPPGAGLLTPGFGRVSFILTWNGIAGRVYRLDHTATLERPFLAVQTVIPGEDGSLTLSLPLDGSQGFYRVTEIEP